MSALLKQPLGKVLTIAVLALGYGLWIFSDTVENWVGMPMLLPLIRLGVIVAGLSAAELIYQAMSHWLSSRHTSDNSKGI